MFLFMYVCMGICIYTFEIVDMRGDEMWKKGKTLYLIYWNALIYDMYECIYVCMCKYFFFAW